MTHSEHKCEELQPSNGPPWGGSYLLDSGGQLNGLQTELDMNGYDSDVTFYTTIDADSSLEEQWFKYPTPFCTDSIDELEDVPSMFSEKDVKDMNSNLVSSAGGTPSPSILPMQENDQSSVADKKLNGECDTRKDNLTSDTDQMDTVGTHAHKRLRKPPQRYIDEISEPTSNPIKKKRVACTTKSSEKILVKRHKVLAAKSRDRKPLPEGEDLLAKAIQVPFAPVSCCEKPLHVATKVNVEPLFVGTKVKKGPRRHLVSKTKFKGDHTTSSSSNLKINQAFGPSCEQVRDNALKPKFKDDHTTSSYQAFGPSREQVRDNTLMPKFKSDHTTSSSSNLKINQAFGPSCEQVRDNTLKPTFKSDHTTSSSTNRKINQAVRRPDEQVRDSQVLHSSSDDRLALVTVPQDECTGVLKSGENGGRRKHHILWTMSEVEKLIDGVSQHGVGRWSRMKNELFPSSPHRTPVDLKDKWRNLLKAFYIQRENKRGESKKRNLAWRPLPKSILERVSELSIKYPYPRDLRSKR